MYVIFTPGFYIEKKSRYMVLFTGLGAIVNVAANLWLLPITNSFWGAAYATLISYLAMTGAIYVVSRKIYPVPWEWRRVLPMICLISVAIVVFYLMQPGFVWRILLLFGILVISFAGILNRREREIARQFLHKTFKRAS
jgi:O-antigen/teichoic acid export membrane protein